MRTNQGRSDEENDRVNSFHLKLSASDPHRAVHVLYVSPTASAGLVGLPRESTPPVVEGSLCLKSSKHCVKLAAATREEKNRRSERVRAGIRCMSSSEGREECAGRIGKKLGGCW